MLKISNSFLESISRSTVSRISFSYLDWYIEFDSENYLEIFSFEEFSKQFGSTHEAVLYLYTIINKIVDSIEILDDGALRMIVEGRSIFIPKENVNLESYAISVNGTKIAV